MSNYLGQFHDQIAALSERLRLPPGGLTPGARSLQISYQDGSTIVINCLEERGELSIGSELCFAPTGERLVELCQTLLEDHVYGRKTDGIYFGLNRAASRFLVFRTLPLDGLDTDRLVAALESLLRTRIEWRKRYDAGQLGSSASPPPSGTEPVYPTGFNFA